MMCHKVHCDVLQYGKQDRYLDTAGNYFLSITLHS